LNSFTRFLLNIAFLSSLCLTQTGVEQAPSRPISGTDQVRIVFPGQQNAITVPMKLIGDVPTIDVEVRGRAGKHRFVIDTGASYTLMDLAAARRLGFVASESGHISGAGSGLINVDLVTGVALEVEGLKTSGHKVVLTDLSCISEMLGSKITGIIGYDFISKVVVTLDYPSKKVTLRRSGSFSSQKETQIVPIRFKRRWAYIPMTVKVPGQPDISDDFLVDTGSADGVNHPLITKSSAPLQKTATGVGLGSSTQGVFGTLEYAQLGSFRISSVPSSCCATNPDTHRQVGSGFLKHFVVTFDYGKQRLAVHKPE